MSTRQRITVILLFLITLGASGCGSGQAATPALAPTQTPTPLPPTNTPLPHWAGATSDNHWEMQFDYNQTAGLLENVSLTYQGDAIHPCAFQVTKIALKPDGSFDYKFSYADLINAMTVNGSISGRLVEASSLSGKLTISLCDSIVYLYEKDLAWTASLLTAGSPTGMASLPASATPADQPTQPASATPAIQTTLTASETPTLGVSFISSAPGNIAFVSGQSIMLMPANGSKAPAILYSTRDQLDWLKWSPEGKKILFSEFGISQSANSGLYRMNADGSGVVRLVPLDFPPDKKLVAWSPDSQRIAFVNAADIYTVYADGSGLTNITKNPGTYASLAWSPDGQKIAFTWSKTDPNNTNAYLIDPDGSGRAELAEDLPSRLAWSPDGMKLAFCASGSAIPGLFVLNRDGSGQVHLSEDLCFNFAWLPDSQRLVFISGFAQIINMDGSGLIDLKQSGLSLSVSPDGNWIALGSLNTIYVVNVDGSAASQVTQADSFNVEPEWQP